MSELEATPALLLDCTMKRVKHEWFVYDMRKDDLPEFKSRWQGQFFTTVQDSGFEAAIAELNDYNRKYYRARPFVLIKTTRSIKTGQVTRSSLSGIYQSYRKAQLAALRTSTSASLRNGAVRTSAELQAQGVVAEVAVTPKQALTDFLVQIRSNRNRLEAFQSVDALLPTIELVLETHRKLRREVMMIE